jgi:ADP-heptose:LPS heptosyltransferase
VLDALAASGRRVFALADAEVAALLELAPCAPLPRLPDLASTRFVVRATECDEALILSGRLDDAWLARSAGVPRRWGYRSLVTGAFLDRRVRPPSRRDRAGRPASEDFRELLAAMDVPWRSAESRLVFAEEHRTAARERLARARVESGAGPLVGVYPGIAGGGSTRPWPRGRFEELVRRLRRDRGIRQIVVLATTEDLWPAVRIHEETGKIHPVIGPDLALDALAALLAKLDLVVAVESSMLDLAAAAGTATVGLYCRDPRRWAPPGNRHRAIGSGKSGSVRTIEVDRVIEACAELS